MAEFDVHQAARNLIDTHGPLVAWQHATILAMQTADAPEAATWVEVIHAIDKLTGMLEPEGVA